MPNFINPYTPTLHHARYKQSPQDFIVNEIMPIELDEQGEHLWLHIQKTQLNTLYVAKLLAKWANIPIKDIGYAGLKDRHAVTTQWFSLRLPKKQSPELDFNDFMQANLSPDEEITLLAQHWHTKKLNRGTHSGNEFIITLRDVKGDKAATDNLLRIIVTQGLPNYFGEQRFGHDYNNLALALELFNKGTMHGKRIHQKFDRDKISLCLSAARSELFNAILARRIELNNWQTPLLGDVINLAGSNSIFVPESIDETIISRLAQGDIHLTGALWGEGALKSFAQVNALETAVIHSRDEYEQLAKGLAQYGLKQQRRPLRVMIQQLSWQWQIDDVLQLQFTLERGCFATTLIACLLVNDAKLTPVI